MKNVIFALIAFIFCSCNLIENNQQDLTKRLRGTNWVHGDYYLKESDGVYRKNNGKIETCILGNILRFEEDSVLMEDAGTRCVSSSYWGKKYVYKLSSDNRSLDILVPNNSLSYKVEAYNDEELNLSLKNDPNGTSVTFYTRLKDLK